MTEVPWVGSGDPLANRFSHHPPSTVEVLRAHEDVRRRCYELAAFLDELLPPGRERDRALDAVDDACQRANAAVARTQLRRVG